MKNERGIRLPDTFEEAIDTLERFVVRARRVEAHSLVKSQKVREFVHPKYALVFNGSSISMRLDSRPEDEEVFESLAARIRPCIVDSEPIQLEKVVAAICILTENIELTERQLKLLNSVNAWYEEHLAPHSYAPIASHEEIGKLGSDEITPASDTLLGLGWYYADLVHADPKQEKEATLEFPYDARYNQGVLLVSYLALVICSLLKLIREINGSHDLGLSADVWITQVTAGGGPYEVGVGAAYVGPAGSVPEQGASIDQMSGFKKLDLVTARRMQCPSCAVDAQLVDEDGNPLATFEGFYAIDKRDKSVNININDEIILKGRPKSDAGPVEELPFDQAFFDKAAQPVEGKIDQFVSFLARAKAAGKVIVTMTWHGAAVGGEITFPENPPVGDAPLSESTK